MEFKTRDLGTSMRERLSKLRQQYNRNTGSRNEVGVQDREMSEASTSTLSAMSDSRESTVTMRGMSETPSTQGAWNSLDDRMDLDPPDFGDASQGTKKEEPFIVATDFGTTFSSIAFARRGPRTRPEIQAISNYPNDPCFQPYTKSFQVPTESWYPNKRPVDKVPATKPSPTKPPATKPSVSKPVRVRDIYDFPSSDEDENLEDNASAISEVEEEVEEEAEAESLLPEIETRDFVWGYGIQKEIYEDMDPTKFNRIARSKLLLDHSPHTQRVRDELEPVLQRLKDGKAIKEDEDVISDFLANLFEHAKTQLKTHHGLTDSALRSIEHVLCIPTIWSSEACRKMQIAMDVATRKADFGTAENLFLVSEPEAAASYVLNGSKQVNPGEVFLILDAGGGTVDATVYKVKRRYPLRLSKELVPPDGCLKGSSFLNEAYGKHLKQRLIGEKRNIEQVPGYTLDGIVETEVKRFETEKRGIDITDLQRCHHFNVPGLKANNKKGFGQNKVYVYGHEFKKIFDPCLQEIEGLMRDQITKAKRNSVTVQKVVLIGGFSASTALRTHLTEKLRDISLELYGRDQIKIINQLDSRSIDIQYYENAVAYGAVLRAWNKEHGPKRKIQSSYGFEITSEYDPEKYPPHLETEPVIDLDGVLTVPNIIDWLIRKGDDVPTNHEYSMPVYRIFPAKKMKKRAYLCEETLYVSDTSTESHYHVDHEKNKGARVAGVIEADMTSLIKGHRIKASVPEKGYAGEKHYRIDFELVMIVNGRNLRYEARWPVGGEVRGEQKQICIAASFRPGTE